mmetsp:Transcript_116660/g.206510  ORF Transcript_116660/g.206510 Transcript_116660/m.206510 type:complete len:220 (-) Transcript_116660:87-746(-)
MSMLLGNLRHRLPMLGALGRISTVLVYQCRSSKFSTMEGSLMQQTKVSDVRPDVHKLPLRVERLVQLFPLPVLRQVYERVRSFGDLWGRGRHEYWFRAADCRLGVSRLRFWCLSGFQLLGRGAARRLCLGLHLLARRGRGSCSLERRDDLRLLLGGQLCEAIHLVRSTNLLLNIVCLLLRDARQLSPFVGTFSTYHEQRAKANLALLNLLLAHSACRPV